MRKRQILPVLTGLLLWTTGCSKGDNNDPPPDTPGVIEITAPLAGTIFINGTPLQVSGNVTDNNALSSVRVEIRNTASGAVYYQQNNPTGNVLFHSFNWSWTISGITSPVNATVKVTATDRYNYQVSKEVSVVLDN